MFIKFAQDTSLRQVSFVASIPRNLWMVSFLFKKNLSRNHHYSTILLYNNNRHKNCNCNNRYSGISTNCGWSRSSSTSSPKPIIVLRHRLKVKGVAVTGKGAAGSSAGANCNGVTDFCNGQQNKISPIRAPNVNWWWAESDSNTRPLARKANVLTRLDDRPTHH